MQKKYENQDHELVTFQNGDATIDAIRYAPLGLLRLKDLSTATGYPAKRIKKIVGAHNVHAIPRSDISISPHSRGTMKFITIRLAFDILKTSPEHQATAAALEIWADDELTGNRALIAAGMTIDARLLYKTLGIREDFHVWAREVEKRHPAETFGTGFHENIAPDGDFPIPLHLSQMLAEETGSFVGLVLATIVSRCGFYHRSYLRLPFVDVLDDFRGVIPSLNNGLVEARQARHILNEGLSLDLWLHALTEDFPMRWGIDYFSETPIPDWDLTMPTPPPPINGPIWFTASLIEEIAAESVYDIGYSDFAAHRELMEGFHSLIAPLNETKTVSVGAEAPHSHPTN